jgi:hypothetical protein
MCRVEPTNQPTNLFESPQDKYTIFDSCIHPRAEALGWILKTKWFICPWSSQSSSQGSQIHLVQPFSPVKRVETKEDQNIWSFLFSSCSAISNFSSLVASPLMLEQIRYCSQTLIIGCTNAQDTIV